MAKQYNISKKSDMVKFQKDLTKTLNDTAKKVVAQHSFGTTCQKCGKKIKVRFGLNHCPYCNLEINCKFTD